MPRRSPRARPTPRTANRRSTSPASSRRGRLGTPRDQIILAPLGVEHSTQAALIYRAGIEGGNATFESEPPTWEEWSDKRAGCPALVACDVEGQLLGWAALIPVSSRPAYRGVGEVSIYVAPEHARRGVGRALLEGLIERSERAGFWTMEAGIFPENASSAALHESAGFRLVGVRRRIGQMPDGRWRDVLLYERRSASVGTDPAVHPGP